MKDCMITLNEVQALNDIVAIFMLWLLSNKFRFHFKHLLVLEKFCRHHVHNNKSHRSLIAKSYWVPKQSTSEGIAE